MVFGWFKRKGSPVPGNRIGAQPEKAAGFRRKVLFEAMEGRVLLSGEFGLPPADLNDPLHVAPDPDALLTTTSTGDSLLADPISAPDAYPDLTADQSGDLLAGSTVVASADSLSLDGSAALDSGTAGLHADTPLVDDSGLVDATGGDSLVPPSLRTEWFSPTSLGGAHEVVLVDGSVDSIDKLIAGILDAPLADVQALLAVEGAGGDATAASSDSATSPSLDATTSPDAAAADATTATSTDAPAADTGTPTADADAPRTFTWVRADGSQVDIVILDPSQDGFQQVSDALAHYSDLSAVHLLSHGDQGSAQLGASTLDADTLAAQADRLAAWGQALGADGDLLLYGCDIAGGDAGIAFVQSLAAATGADVAASDDITGIGGDWVLEYSAGVIETSAFSVDPLGVWDFRLGTIAGTDGVDTLTSTAGNDTLIGKAGNDIYKFANNFGTDVVSEAGTGGTDDVLDFSAVTSALTFTFMADGKIEVSAGGANKVTASNVESIKGGSGTNTFVFKDGASLKGDLTSLGTNIFTFEGASVIRIDQFADSMNKVGGTPPLLASQVTTGSGNDSVLGDNSAETFDGGAGNDILAGNGGNDTLKGGAGDDRLYDQKYGGSNIVATTGNDTFAGGTGDDTYVISRNLWGQDKIDEAAGEGSDTIDMSALTAGLTVTFNSTSGGFQVSNGSHTLSSTAGDILNVEHLQLGSGTNTIVLDDGWKPGLTITSAGATPSAVLDLSAVSGDLRVELLGGGKVEVTDAGGNKLILSGIASIKGGTGNNVFVIKALDALSGDITQAAAKAAGKTNVLDYSALDTGSHVPVVVDTTTMTATGLKAGTGTAAFEVQSLTLGGATGGSFRIGMDAATVELPWNVTAADLEAALKACPGVGDVKVTGGGPFTITFEGAEWNRAQLALDTTGLTGATAAGISTTTEGATTFQAGAFAGVGKVILGDGTGLYIGGTDAATMTLEASQGGAVVDAGTGAIHYSFADARNITVSEVTTGTDSVKEVQRLVVQGQGGTFTLKFGDKVTAPITWSSNDTTLAASIQAALNASGVGANVAVTVDSSAGAGAFKVAFNTTGDKALLGYDLTNLEGVTGGSRGDSSVLGSAGADQVLAGARGDTIDGAGGNDTLVGNSGADTIHGGSGDDAVSGGSGNDNLLGDAGKDTLAGGAGDDTLTGGAGDDLLDGGSGNDTYVFADGFGKDRILEGVDGGGSADTLDFTAVSTGMTFVLSNGFLQAGTGAFTPTVAQDSLSGLTQSSGKVEGSFAAGVNDILTVGTDLEKATASAPHDESFFGIETVKLPAADTTVLFGNDWSQGVSALATLTPEVLRNFFDTGDRELTLDSAALTAAGKNLVLDFRQVTEGLEFTFEKVEDKDANGNVTGWHVQLTIEKTRAIGVPLLDDPIGEASFGKLTITNIDANTTIYGGRQENTFKLSGDVVVDADVIGGTGLRALSNYKSYDGFVDIVNAITGLDMPDLMVTNTIDYTESSYFGLDRVWLSETSTSVATHLENTSDGVHEVQKLAITGATGGNFTLGFGGQTTAAIAYSSTAKTLVSNINAAIAANATLAAADIEASVADDGSIHLTFNGSVLDQALMTVNAAGLAGGSAAAAITEVTPGERENQTQRFGYSAEKGTFTLSYGGQTTAALAWNATAAQVKTALEGLSTVHAGGVTVTGTGSYNDPFVFKFTDTATRDSDGAFLSLSANSSALARSDQHLSISPVTDGAGPLVEIQRIVADATGGSFTLGFGGASTAPIAWNASAADVQAALRNVAGLANVDVSGSGTAADPWKVVFNGQAPGANDVALLTADSSLLTGGTHTASVALEQDGTATAATNEVQRVSSTLTGTDTFYLTYNGQRSTAIGAGATAADVEAALESINPKPAAEVTVVREGVDGTSPVTEKITLSRTADAGTFVVKIGASSTAAIAWNASRSELQTALAAIAPGVVVTGGSGGEADPWQIEFSQVAGSYNVPAVTVDTAGLARDKIIDVSVTRAGSAGNYSYDITFNTPAATDIPLLGVIEPGATSQSASQFTGKLLNISDVNYSGAANFMVGSNIGLPYDVLKDLFTRPDFLSNPGQAATTWYNGLSAELKAAFTSGNVLGADHFSIGGNPLTQALDDATDDSGAGVKALNALLGSVIGEFMPETFSPGVHILAGMTGGDTYSFSGTWGLAAVVEVPDVIINGVTVPEAFDTLDLSGVDNDLEITVYEITADNLAAFAKMFSNIESDAATQASGAVPALTIGSNVVVVRDKLMGTEAEVFGGGEIPAPIPDGNYIIANDIENLIVGGGENTIRFVGNAHLGGTVSGDGEIVLDYSHYTAPTGVNVNGGAGVDYELTFFDPNDFLPKWYIDVFGKPEEFGLSYTYGSADAVIGSRLAGFEAVLASMGVPSVGQFMANFAVASLTGVVGTEGNDTLRGNSGDNSFDIGNGGTDHLYGMDGDDQAGFGDAEGGVIVDLAAQKAWYRDGDLAQPVLSNEVQSFLTATGVAEVQQLAFSNVASGTFTLTVDGTTTGAITWSGTAATLVANTQAALDAALGEGVVTVKAGSGAGTLAVTFADEGPQAAIAVATGSLTASSGVVGVVVTETVAGEVANARQTVAHDAFAGSAEVQTLSFAATGGSFQLRLGEWTTASIAWSSNDTTLKSALQSALDAALGAGKVTVSLGDAAGSFDLEFADNAPQDLFTVTASTLVAASAGTPALKVEEAASGALSTGSFTLSYNGATTAAIAANAAADDVKAALEALSTITTVTVAGTGTTDDPWAIHLVAADQDAGGDFYALDMDTAGLLQVVTAKDTAPAAGTCEVQQLAFSANPGATGSFTLTVAGQTTGPIAWSATDATLRANIQKAIDAACGTGVATVATTGTNDTFTLTFEEAGAQQPVTADLGGLSSTPAASVAITVATAGANESAATRERQEISFSNATGGTFKLAIGTLETAPITWSANDALVLADIQAKLDTLLGSGKVTVTDTGTSVFRLDWAATGFQPEVVVSSSLTGAGAAGTVATLVNGLSANAIQSFGHNADGGSFTIAYGSQVTGPIAADASADQIRDALKALPAVRQAEVSGSGTLGDPWVITLQDADLDAGGKIKELVFTTADVANGMAANTVVTDLVATSDAVQEVQRLELHGGTGSFTLNYGATPTAAIAWSADDAVLAGRIQSALNAILPAGQGVTVSVSAANTFDITFAKAGPVTDLTATITGLAGAATSAAVSEVTAGQLANAVQTLSHDGVSGSFTLKYGSESTAAIAWNATAAQVKSALEALTGIADGNGVTVTGSGHPDDPWVITFQNADKLATVDAFKPLSLVATNLKAVTATVDAGSGTHATQTLVSDATQGLFRLAYNGEYTAWLAVGAPAADVKAALEALKGITTVAVSGTGATGTPYSFSFTSADQASGNYYALAVDSTQMAGPRKATWSEGLVRQTGDTPVLANVYMDSIEFVEGSGEDDIFIGSDDDNQYTFVGEWGHDVIYETAGGGDDRIQFLDDDGEKLAGVKSKVLGNGVTFYWLGDEANPTASLYAYNTEGAPDDDRGIIAAFLEDTVHGGIETFYKDTVLGGIKDVATLTAETSGNVTTELTQAQLQPVVEEAIRRWVAAGADEAFLRGLRVELADLDGSAIGQTGANTVYLDRTANGNGWYVDATPQDDLEFGVDGPGYLAWAAEGTSAADGIDLLTVVMHEFGHQLGFPHDGSLDTIMRDSMAEGMRIVVPTMAGEGGPLAGEFTAAQDDQEKLLNGLTLFRDWADDFGGSIDSYFGSLTLPLIDVSIDDLVGGGLTGAATSVTDSIRDGMDLLYTAAQKYFSTPGVTPTVQGMIDALQADPTLAGIVQIDRSGSTNPNEFAVVIHVAGFDESLDISTDALGGFLSVDGDQVGVSGSIDLAFVFGLDANGNFYVEQPGVRADFQVGHENHDIIGVVTDDNGASAGGNGRFIIAGDRSAEFAPLDDIAVLDSYGNDGFYRITNVIKSVDADGNDITILVVDGTISHDVADGTLRNTYDFGLNVGPFGVEVENGIIGVGASVEFGTDAHLSTSDLTSQSLLSLVGMPHLDADAGYEILLPVSFGGILSGVDGDLGAISAFSGDLPPGASLLQMIAAVPNTVNFYGMDEIFDMKGISLDMIIEGLYAVLDELVGTEPGTTVDSSVTTLTTGVAGSAETQLLSFSNVTGGTFSLSLGDVSTGPITWDADANTLKASLQGALDTAFGSGAITVATGSGGFSLAFAEQGNQDPLRINQGGLTGSGASAAVTEAVAGTGTGAVQRLVISNAMDGYFTLAIDGKTTLNIAWDGDDANLADDIAAALNAAGVLGAGAVSVTTAGDNTFDIRFREAGVQSALTVDTSHLSAGEAGAIYDKLPLLDKSAAELLGGGGVDFLASMRDAIGQARQLSSNIQELESYLNNGLAEVLGLDVPAIAVTELTAGTATTSEVQQLAFSETTGGVFTLGLGAQTTAEIAWDADDAVLAQNIQNALNAVLGASAVSVAATATAGTFTVTFAAHGAQADLVADAGQLAGTFDLISMSYADNAFHFGLNAEFAAHYDDAFGISLADLGALVGLPDLNGIGLDLSAAAKLDLDASALFNLGFGFDLSNALDPAFYIDDSTGIDLHASAALSALDITAAFSVAGVDVGMFARDGSAGVALDLSIGLIEGADEGRYDPLALTMDDVEVVAGGQAFVDLPLYFPLESIPAGGHTDDLDSDGYGDNVLHLEASFSYDVLNHALDYSTEYVVPDLVPSFGIFDIVNDPERVLTGVEGIFDNLKAGVESKFAELVLPMVGDKLQDAADFIGDLKFDLLGDQASSTGEIQKITFGNVTGGSFTLGFGSQVTAAIAWSSDAKALRENVQAALDATLGAGVAEVLSTVDGHVEVGFAASAGNEPNAVVGKAGLTGTGVTATVTEIAAGARLWRDDNGFATVEPTGHAYYEDGGLGAALQEAIANGQSTVELVRHYLFEKLGQYLKVQRIGADGLPEFDAYGNPVCDDLATEDQIQLGIDDTGALTFNVLLSGNIFSTSVPIDFSLAAPGLPLSLEISPESQIDISLDYYFGLGFGFDSHGLFLDASGVTEDGAELALQLTGVLSDGTRMDGVLGLLAASLEEKTDSDGHSGLQGRFTVDITDGNDDHIYANEFGAMDITARLEASANADLDAELRIAVPGVDSAELPKLTTTLHYDQVFANVEFGTGGSSTSFFEPAVIVLEDVTLDLGSFITDFLGPIVDQVHDVTAPLEPLVDVLTTPIGILEQLGAPQTTLLEIASTILGQTKYAGVVKAVNAVVQIIDLVRTIDSFYDASQQSGASSIGINFGSFTLGGDAGSTAQMDSTAQSFDANAAFNASKGTANGGQQAAASSLMKSFTTTAGGWEFPILTNPSSVLGLITGDSTVDLFKYNLPALALDFQYVKSIPIPGLPGLNARFGGGVSATTNITLGYDTTGINEWRNTLDGSQEAQEITVDGATGGTFTLSDGTVTTDPIAWADSDALLASNIGAALDKAFGAGRGVSVVVTAANTFKVVYEGEGDRNQLTADTTYLKGSSVAVDISTLQEGSDSLDIVDAITTLPTFALDGFYLDDHVTGTGASAVDAPEATIQAKIIAGASLGIGGLIEAGVEGNITATINFDLNDVEASDTPGKVYGDELLTQLSCGPQCVFDVNGALTAGLDAFLWIGLDLGFFGKITLFEQNINLFNAVIAEFSYTCPDLPPPILGSIDYNHDGSITAGEQLDVVLSASELQVGSSTSAHVVRLDENNNGQYDRFLWDAQSGVLNINAGALGTLFRGSDWQGDDEKIEIGQTSVTDPAVNGGAATSVITVTYHGQT